MKQTTVKATQSSGQQVKKGKHLFTKRKYLTMMEVQA